MPFLRSSELLSDARSSGALRSPERRQPRLSSLELGEALATWMKTQEEEELAQPWRGSKDLWHTLLGMILFEKAKPLVARNFWRTYARRWDTPQSYLEDPRREAATRAIGRGGAGELLGQIARALTRGEDLPLSGGVKLPGLSRERLLYAATLCGSARSSQPTGQTTRIAKRVFGENIGDSRIEEQLALVRLIGALHSGPAYGALLEVGDRFCVPSEPRCQPCPLHEMCVTGQKRTRELHPMLFSDRD